MTNVDGCMSKKAAAAFAAVSQRYIDYERARGSLPYFRLGRKVVFKKADIIVWLERHRVDVTDMAVNS